MMSVEMTEEKRDVRDLVTTPGDAFIYDEL